MSVNLRPHFVSAQAAAPGMKAAGGGSIINFSSISYMMGQGAYPPTSPPRPGSPG